MNYRSFASQALANAVGTVLAVAAIYVGGVVVGVPSFDAGAPALSIVSLVIAVLGVLAAGDIGRWIDDRQTPRQ